MSRSNDIELRDTCEMRDINVQYSDLRDESSPIEPQSISVIMNNTSVPEHVEEIQQLIVGASGNANGAARQTELTKQIRLNGNVKSCTMKRSKSTHSICASVKDLSIKTLPFEIVWSNLTLNFTSGILKRISRHLPCSSLRRSDAESANVLCNLSGRLRTNELLAVLGPSGCGKTTLLRCLAGRYRPESGTLRVHGLDELRVSFMPQDDCLLPGLTARETLHFASHFQNSHPNFNHKAHIDNMIARLGLNECADRRVNCLSGGQMKRVTIAQELLYPTNLLILDEVTSGLDASSSLSIVRLLKSLTSNDYPMSIVVSIHQPSAKIFNVFDRVYAMTNGQCMFEGPTNSETIMERLKMFNLECPLYSNVADYLLEVATDEQQIVGKQKMIDYHQKQYESHQGDTNNLSDVYDDEVSADVFSAVVRARCQNESPFWSHSLLHLQRSWLRIRRSYLLTYLQLTTYILLGLQVSTFYGTQIGELSGCPRNPMHLVSYLFSKDNLIADQTLEMRHLQENLNALFIIVMTSTFLALEITVISFPMDARVIRGEWNNGLYKSSTYFIGRTAADFPFQLCFVLIFSTLVYILTGQLGLTSWRFVSFTYIMIMTALFAQSIGFMFGAIFLDQMAAAIFLAPIFVFPSLLFSGFLSRVAQVPAIYVPMTYLSYYRHCFDALIVTIYGHQRCHCDPKVLSDYQDLRNNQSSYVRDLFNTMFGVIDCSMGNTETPTPIDDNILDDLAPKIGSNTSTLHQTPNKSDDHLGEVANEFANKLTSLLSQQANYGRQVPTNCDEYDTYLMKEFNLHDSDLLGSLLVLMLFVLTTRILCSVVLSLVLSRR